MDNLKRRCEIISMKVGLGSPPYCSEEDKCDNCCAQKADRATHEFKNAPVPLVGRIDISARNQSVSLQAAVE